MVDLHTFRNKVQEYLRLAGESQKNLARTTGLNPSVFSSKLNGNGKTFSYPEIKSIVKILAEWRAITRQTEAEELLELMGLSKNSFTATEWNSEPLNFLELEPAILESVNTGKNDIIYNPSNSWPLPASPEFENNTYEKKNNQPEKDEKASQFIGANQQKAIIGRRPGKLIFPIIFGLIVAVIILVSIVWNSNSPGGNPIVGKDQTTTIINGTANSTGSLSNPILSGSPGTTPITFSPTSNAQNTQNSQTPPANNASNSEATSLKLELSNTLTGHLFSVNSIALKPDGKVIASGSDDGTVKLWDSSGKQISSIKMPSTGLIKSVKWSPDGKILAVASTDLKIYLLNEKEEQIATLKGHTDVPVVLAWSPDGKLLASGSWDKTIRLWRSDGTFMTSLLGPTNWISGLTWSPDSKTLATTSKDNTLRFWNIENSGKEINQIFDKSVNFGSIAWSPDGNFMAVGVSNGTVRLVNNKQNQSITFAGRFSQINCLAWSPDSKEIVIGSNDGSFSIWNTENKEVANIKAHKEAINDVIWSSDGRTLLTGSTDSTIRLWNIS